MEDLNLMMNERLAAPVEDRQFQLREHAFTIRPSIRPQAMRLFNAIGEAPDDAGGAEALRAFMDAVLVDGEIALWDELCERTGDDALTIADMTSAAGFALRQAVGRPPTRLPSSGPTSSDQPPGTESADESRLRVAGSKA